MLGIRSCLTLFVSAVFAILSAPAALALSSTVQTTFDVKIVVSDGTVLSADIYRPKAEGRYPVIITRSPYDNSKDPDAFFFAENGYVYITVDVRGRYDSEGEFVPYKYEARDGYDVIQWAAEQEWSNGSVGVIGGSYQAFANLLAAGEAPPALKTMISRVSPSDYYDAPAHTGGAFNFAGRLSWLTLVDDHTNQNLMAHDWDKGLSHLPLIEADRAIGRDMPIYREWVTHSSRSDFWAALSMQEEWENINVPLYHQGGWYDEFLRGTLGAYRSLSDKAATSDARRNQYLLIGPWTHGMRGGVVGNTNFGPDSVVNLQRGALEWFDWRLKGKKSSRPEHKVNVFLMGENRWVGFEQWPPKKATQIEFYLSGGGRANTRNGDGRLTRTPSADSSADTYVYDPENPTPTVGGATCCVYPGFYPEIMQWGPWDQRNVEMRNDVLVYTSEPLTQDLTIAGPVSVEIYAASSAIDTDFTAKLVDVAPDGYATNLTDGIIRARYRNSKTEPEFLEPGEVYPYTIDLADTANTFKAGHSIRIEISSSNFPWYDRNLNTGQDLATGVEIKTADQKLFHGAPYPSRLLMHAID